MHDVFHVSMLRKYIQNPALVSEYELLDIQEELACKEMDVRIMDRKEQVLHTKRIPIVKVLSCNHGLEKASWEA